MEALAERGPGAGGELAERAHGPGREGVVVETFFGHQGTPVTDPEREETVEGARLRRGVPSGSRRAGRRPCDSARSEAMPGNPPGVPRRTGFLARRRSGYHPWLRPRDRRRETRPRTRDRPKSQLHSRPGPYPHDLAVPADQGGLSRHPAVLPHGGLLRALLRRCGARGVPARHHADAARAV